MSDFDKAIEQKHDDAAKPKTVEKVGLCTLVGILVVLCHITAEVGKQTLNYSIQYYNGGVYPLPQTAILVLVEIIKLAVIISTSGCSIPSFDTTSLRTSLKYLPPSLLYAVGSNIYMLGITLVPAPIWIILTAFRTVFSAVIYKFVLKREVSVVQLFGASLIVSSIIVAKIGDILQGNEVNRIPAMAIILAFIASGISVSAAIYMENIFKRAGQNFLEQQFWLYFYGLLVGLLLFLTSSKISDTMVQVDALLSSQNLTLLLVAALLFSGVGGLVVAMILKKLDNIVKEYSTAVGNIFIALLSSFLFPEKFQVTPYILISLLLLFIGIYLYEVKKLSCTENKNKSATTEIEEKV